MLDLHKRRNKRPTFSASRNVDEGGMKKNCRELEVEIKSTSQQRHPADHRVRSNPRKCQEIRAETLEDGVTLLRNLCWSSALPELHILRMVLTNLLAPQQQLEWLVK